MDSFKSLPKKLYSNTTQAEFPYDILKNIKQELTLNCASRSACPSIIPISSFIRSKGAFSPNMLKLFKKSMNILNSDPVTSSILCSWTHTDNF